MGVKEHDKRLENARKQTEIDDLSNKFISRVQTVRHNNLKITQNEMASKLDIKPVTYKKYEQGVLRTDVPYFIHTLSKALDVSADYIVGLSDYPHPDYNEVTKKTGLNDKAIQTLINLNLKDDGEQNFEYSNFINCFLGNSGCTELFFMKLQPILFQLYEASQAEYQSTKLLHMLEINISDIIYEYISKVVIPTYNELCMTGAYTTPSIEKYCTNIPPKE